MIPSLTALGLAVALAAPLSASAAPGEVGIVALPNPSVPMVDVRLLFRVGAVDDPPGKEGLAALTARMVAESGTARRTFAELEEALYPMAASWAALVDEEVTTLVARVHRDHLPAFTDLFMEAVVAPGFRQEDLERHRQQLAAILTTTLRSASDELLGFAALHDQAFAEHPYRHPPQGTESGLAAITLDDVRAFYRTHYTRERALLGLAGGYPETYPARLTEALEALPVTGTKRAPIPPPAPVTGRHVTLVDKRTASTGIHFAHPIAVRPGHPDYPALVVAASYLGEHRTFHGRLMQQLRGLRGLNYGDYAYVEHYHNPPGTSQPTPNVARQHQLFTVWVRPVAPDRAHFVLRAAVHEVDRLTARGLTEEELDLTRDFLVRYARLWGATASRRLGFAMDGRLYGLPEGESVIDLLGRELPKLSVEQVNQAIRRHLGTQNLHVVLVAGDAVALAERLRADAPSPITYESPVPPEVTEADRVIQTLKVAPASVRVVPVDQLFR